MANFFETLIETIEKDFKLLESIDNEKLKRKEVNLLKARIKSALKLVPEDPEKAKKLTQLLEKIS